MNHFSMYHTAVKLVAKVACNSNQGKLLSILIYHRVLPRIDEYSLGTVDACTFEIQMATLAEHFNVLPLDEALERLKSNSLPSRAACVTFDDGYADNSEIALPILRKYNIRATFFIATGYLDGGIMWNDIVIETIRRCKYTELNLQELNLQGNRYSNFDLSQINNRLDTISQLLSLLKYKAPTEREKLVKEIANIAEVILPTNLMMTCNQVRNLYDNGMLVGGHTVAHPILAQESDKMAEQEIREGKLMLEELLHVPVDMFAYPNGKAGVDYEYKHVKMVKDIGFKLAVSTNWGVSNRQSDIFQLPRFSPWDSTPKKFIARLLHNSWSRREPNVQVENR